jgi:Skp family chaperone for outer membrane proteins
MPASQEDYIVHQVEQHKRFLQELENIKKAQQEEIEKREGHHLAMMDKMKGKRLND